MAGPLPRAVTLSPPQQAVLEALLRQHSTPQTLALRVRIVLAAACGMRNLPMTRDLACSLKTVIKWRARWAAAEAHLATVEHDPPELKRMVGRVLADAPRPGAPDTFTAEQIVQLINLACTPPADAGRPLTAWTPRELADEAVKRQIVPTISPTSVGRFLQAGRTAAASQPLLAYRQDQSR
ncbi:MAG: helix-turn-helix domain-containing protein [Herpetosiphonaceae bacterium]|nr:helix-turn-helix domain-containing protein [Herpetosiphonaceae bacterium]